MTAELENALAGVLDRRDLVVDPDVMASYAHDHCPTVDWEIPAAVAFPRSTDQVAGVLGVAAALGVPVVPRGAGSGLAGGANAVPGSLVVSTERMTAIRQIDAAERIAVVEAGVVTGDLRAAAAQQGLYYPPDPGSVAFSTIGGNVATNAGGMCCVKYGVTADFVLGLTVVLPDGRVMRTGRRTAKGVAGYDLTRLFVGSEGTLGIVTEIVLRLVPQPAAPATLVGTFDCLDDAGAAVARSVAAGAVPSMLEILDATTLSAIDELTRMGVSGQAAMLLAQVDGPGAAAEADQLAGLWEEAGAVDLARTDDPAEGHALIEARRLALPALEGMGPCLLDDVVVPRAKVVDLVRAVSEIAGRSALTVGVFGHAGDGNLHPTIVHRPEQRAEAEALFDEIVAAALELGGTCTGEHGVGRLKREWLRTELDPVALEIQHRIRAAIDPAELMNPGSVIEQATSVR